MLANDSSGLLSSERWSEWSTASIRSSRRTAAPTSANTFSAGTRKPRRDGRHDVGSRHLAKLNRGGHDPEKVYAAYHATRCITPDQPTVILAKTVKGYGMGEAGEGTEHHAPAEKARTRNELIEFPRPLRHSDLGQRRAADVPYFMPSGDSPEVAVPARAAARWLGRSTMSKRRCEIDEPRFISIPPPLEDLFKFQLDEQRGARDCPPRWHSCVS